MPLNCGIVGLPNVGKSTIFNALTSAKAQAANYPFCTIDPNTGVVTVPDERLAKIAQLIQPKSLVATTMEFIDIAGLVEGASKAKASVISFSATSARPSHRARCPLLRRSRGRPRRRRRQSPARHRHHQYRAIAGRPGYRRETPRQGRKGRKIQRPQS